MWGLQWGNFNVHISDIIWLQVLGLTKSVLQSYLSVSIYHLYTTVSSISICSQYHYSYPVSLHIVTNSITVSLLYKYQVSDVSVSTVLLWPVSQVSGQSCVCISSILHQYHLYEFKLYQYQHKKAFITESVSPVSGPNCTSIMNGSTHSSRQYKECLTSTVQAPH